jgi:hypothetical protein
MLGLKKFYVYGSCNNTDGYSRHISEEIFAYDDKHAIDNFMSKFPEESFTLICIRDIDKKTFTVNYRVYDY